MEKHCLLCLFLLLCFGNFSRAVNCDFLSNSTCSVRVEENCYVIHFVLPSYQIQVHETGLDGGCGTFSEVLLSDEDYDEFDIQSFPNLPFFSIDLPIPANASIARCTFNVMDKISENLIYPIMPTIEEETDVDDILGDLVGLDQEKCFDEPFYIYGDVSRFPYCSINYRYTPIYAIGSSNFSTLSIYPFSYFPRENLLTITKEAEIRIYIDSKDEYVESYIQRIQDQSKYDSFMDFVSSLYMSLEFDNIPEISYLIIASSYSMKDYLQDFVDYKEKYLGYQVKTLYCDVDNIGASSDELANAIQAINPDYVLLVGPLDKLPAFEGNNSRKNPYSDDGYHSYLGRWIVGEDESEKLNYIVRKTILSEMAYFQNPNTAALFSGDDSKSKYMRNHFWKDIVKISDVSFNKIPLQYTLCDGRNSSTSIVDIRQSLVNDSARFFIYSGHGNKSGISTPYNFTSSNIDLINTKSPYPMGFGFACWLNHYLTGDVSFAKQWILDQHGGVSFYGSTYITKTGPDRALAKKLFSQYKTLYTTSSLHYIPISVLLRIAETKYYNALQGCARRRQIKQYNLNGDPSFLMDGVHQVGFQKIPVMKNVIQDQSVTDKTKVVGLNIYNTMGNHILYTNIIDTNLQYLDIPDGVYLLEYLCADGEQYVIKQCKHHL